MICSVHISYGQDITRYADFDIPRAPSMSTTAQANHIVDQISAHFNIDETFDVDIVQDDAGHAGLCTIRARNGVTVMSISAAIGWSRDGLELAPSDHTPTPWMIRNDEYAVDWTLIRTLTDRTREAQADAMVEQDAEESTESAVEMDASDTEVVETPDPAPEGERTDPVIVAMEAGNGGEAPITGQDGQATDREVMLDGAETPAADPIRVATTAEAVTMEDAPLAGAETHEWNNVHYVVLQHQVLTRPLPLVGANAMTMDGGSVPRVCRELATRFPWMMEAVDAITRSCHIQTVAGDPWFHIDPMLLVGDPGCGKTSFVRTLARLVGMPWNMLDCGSVHDSVTISGTPRGYSTTTPCWPAGVMQRIRIANPILHLDEIDKATKSTHGWVVDGILSMTEPTTADRYLDQCLMRWVDLSRCSWIATANDASRLGSPFHSRFAGIRVPMPGPEHLTQVIAGLAEETAERWRLPIDALAPIPTESRKRLRDVMEKGSLRTVAKVLRDLWTRDIMENGRPGLN